MATPIIIQFLEAQRARLLALEESELERLAREWKNVERRLEAEIRNVAQAMADRKGRGLAVTDTAVLQLTSLQDLLVQVRSEMSRFATTVEQEIVTHQEQFIHDALADAAQALTLLDVDNFTRLPVGAVERMIGLAGDGSPVRAHLDKAFPDASARLLQILVENTALGVNPNTTARNMVDLGLGAGFDRMASVTRTEQLRPYREASLDQYRASGVVQAYRRLSAKQIRTCMACLLADGEVYEIGEAFPTHVRCRCSFVPVIINRPLTRWTYGREWFLLQSMQVQQEMLGPGRYQAWRSGTFDLRDLVQRRDDAVWGPQIRVASLKELRNG